MESFGISSEEIKRNGDASIDVENLHFSLANSVRRELETLPPLSEQYCIYRVPKQLRQLDEKFYTPQLVSIGPLRHGRLELKPMEEHKRRYLQDFLQRTEVSVENFVSFIKEREARLRNCYAETIGLGSDDFVKMILVDAMFIIEYLLGYSFPEFQSRNYPMFAKQRIMSCIKFDILLLENQLPFFIIEDLLKLANIYISNYERPSTIKLIHNLAKEMWDLDLPKGLLEKNPSPAVEHFVDFLRICHQPLKPSLRNKLKNLSMPSLKELQQAELSLSWGQATTYLT